MNTLDWRSWLHTARIVGTHAAHFHSWRALKPLGAEGLRAGHDFSIHTSVV